MGRPKNSIPKLCTDASGRAFTKVCGRFISLGKAGTPDAAKRYAAVLTAHADGTLTKTANRPQQAVKSAVTINELIFQFVAKEIPRYSAGEAHAFRAAIKVFRPMFGDTPVEDFGPLRYRLVRDAMVAGDPHAVDADGKPSPRKPWCRKTVNRQIKRIRQIFRWGVSLELVPVSVLQNLDTVRSLAIGETAAVDNAPRLAVPEADIEAVRQQLLKHHRDLFDLLILTGARPGELLKITGGMLQRRSDVWLAELSDHKTARKGKRRFLAFNKSAQAILLRNMKSDPDAPLFTQRRDNFTGAVNRACKRAGVKPFCPHQLRHTTAARLVDEVGLEAAQAVLGHSEIAMTLHYSRSAEKTATEAVKRLG